MENKQCPKCKKELSRDYKLPGVVYECLICDEKYCEWPPGQLMTSDEYRKFCEEFSS